MGDENTPDRYSRMQGKVLQTPGSGLCKYTEARRGVAPGG